MVINEEMVYILQKAGDRLQQEANNCRGTVCDDYKAYGLQLEADAIRQAVNIFVRQMGHAPRGQKIPGDVITPFLEGLNGK